jgi:hypothetical protein
MPFPQEPLNPEKSDVDKIRLRVGDFDHLNVELSHALYEYFLLVSEDNLGKATILAAKALVAKYSRAMEEETDAVKAKVTDRLEGYRLLLGELQRDFSNFSIYASGISTCERVEDRLTHGLRDNALVVGEGTGHFSKIGLHYPY